MSGLLKKLKSFISPAMSLSDWEEWDVSVHMADGQAGRMQRALMQDMEIEKIFGRDWVRGSTGEHYLTDYKACTCKDFERRHVPCKHMYLRAMKTAGFDLVPYIIRSDIEAHSMRGFMNMGMYKVKGKNPETGRMNTKTVYAVDEAGALELAKPFGLCDPLKIEEVPFPDADPALIDEATSIGVYVPEGAKKPDVEASILRYKNVNETTIYRSEWEYAASLGIMLSALDGITGAKDAFHKNHKRWRNNEQLVGK